LDFSTRVSTKKNSGRIFARIVGANVQQENQEKNSMDKNRLIEAIAGGMLDVPYAEDLFMCGPERCGVNQKLKSVHHLLHETGKMWDSLDDQEKKLVIGVANQATSFWEDKMGDMVLNAEPGHRVAFTISAALSVLWLFDRQAQCEEVARGIANEMHGPTQ
jgi:hypothetical protein